MRNCPNSFVDQFKKNYINSPRLPFITSPFTLFFDLRAKVPSAEYTLEFLNDEGQWANKFQCATFDFPFSFRASPGKQPKLMKLLVLHPSDQMD